MSEAGKEQAPKAPKGGNPMEKERADAKADKKASRIVKRYAKA